MRILILEDDQQRIKWFRRSWPQHTLDITPKPTRAIWLLQKHAYHLIMLDHDLAVEHYSILSRDHLPGSGMDVAVWLSERPEVQADATIVVHSCNVVSAPKMQEVLLKRGHSGRVLRIPFVVIEAGLARLL